MIKKVIVVKDIPSNIFEEVSFTVREGVNIDVNNDYDGFKTESILIEAEGIIQEYINKYENVEIKKESIFDKIFNKLKKE
mgnify:FL=1